MAVYPSGRKLYSKIRVAPGAAGRRTYQLAPGLDQAGAEQRDALLTELAEGMADAKFDADKIIDPLLRKLAEGDAAEAERVESYIRSRLLSGKRRPVEEVPTVRQFGSWWTSGELTRRYPQQVRTCKFAAADERKLARHVYAQIGDLPIAAVKVEHLEQVLRALPEKLAGSTKRMILSRLHRLLDLAVYPAKYLDHNPMPRGFKPRATRSSFAFLYPTEEEQLLNCRRVPLSRRVAYGLAARLGLRVGEACGLRWRDVDLERGALRLEAHKTAAYTGARVVPLDEGSVRVLTWWRRVSESLGEEHEGDLVINWGVWISDRVLSDLMWAGVRRRELHESGATSKGFSFHGFRRTFVTLALGDGRTEDWVMRRTGHTTSAMLAKYRIAAANAAEFRLGWLRPFDEALPEIADSLEGKTVRDRRNKSVKRLGAEVTISPPHISDGGEQVDKPRENEGVNRDSQGAQNHRGQATDRLARVSLLARRVSDLRPSLLLTRRAS